MSTRLAGALISGVLTFSAAGAQSADSYQLLFLDGQAVKWGSPVQGSGAIVRYGFVSAPVSTPGARNCGDMISVDTLLEANGISQRTFRQEVGAAFANWSAVADITFAVTDDPAQADILIGAQATPTGFAYANVSYDPTVTGAMHRIDKSLVCLNPRRPWKVGFDGNRDIYDLRYTLTHEIGHAIGLDHPPSSDQLMDFVYREKFQGLQSGDIAGVATLYGAPPMPIAQQRAVTTSMPAVTER